jgi:hypothetical protein
MNQERIAQLVERAPVAFGALRGMADTLTTLEVKRVGFEPTDDEMDAMVYLWWTASCNEDPGVATFALSMLEDFTGMGREDTTRKRSECGRLSLAWWSTWRALPDGAIMLESSCGSPPGRQCPPKRILNTRTIRRPGRKSEREIRPSGASRKPKDRSGGLC